MKKKFDKEICINVLGTVYTLNFYDYETSYYGVTDFKNKTIEIFRDLSKEQKERTIIHELLHAYLFESGLEKYSSDELLLVWLDKFIPVITKDLKDINKIVK